ncbi:uncharacterized protein LOC111398519 [Olea europaea subsp. europaea]|uniref:Uncharacterized protein LOC111398519 n=1 Tax=Olea europaea subsp. europaea TaxID=158383 RepID=A0A8S0RAS7_OLEEU|nr:uncharacterized protein LOC111398519 [Olea europaea subsp. europaea]
MTASANLSGRFIKDNNSNGTANGATSIDGALPENAVATFHPNSSASFEWSTDEQSILEDLLSKYSSDTIIVRYAKIAQQLNDKTVRDVALRCKWMTKKGYGKRGKDDQNSLRKNKDKKVDNYCIQSSFPVVFVYAMSHFFLNKIKSLRHLQHQYFKLLLV